MNRFDTITTFVFLVCIIIIITSIVKLVENNQQVTPKEKKEVETYKILLGVFAAVFLITAVIVAIVDNRK